jgi:hypothetical protein
MPGGGSRHPRYFLSRISFWIRGMCEVEGGPVTSAQTNLLRTQGTDILLAAAPDVDVQRIIAQSYANFRYAQDGVPIKEAPIAVATEARGASNAKAKLEPAWTLCYPSWRPGFRGPHGLPYAVTAAGRRAEVSHG